MILEDLLVSREQEDSGLLCQPLISDLLIVHLDLKIFLFLPLENVGSSLKHAFRTIQNSTITKENVQAACY